MPIKSLIIVDGVELPMPSTYSGNTSTLVDSSRNVKGVMVGSVIRDDVAKVEATWRYLTVAEWAMINSLFKRSAGGSFINPVEFFDQSAGKYITRQMYVSDRKAGLWRVDPQTGKIMGWRDCSLNLIEV